MKFSLALLVLSVMTASASSQPLNKIDKALSERLSGFMDNDLVQVIVVMEDQVDLRAMKDQFNARRATKEERVYEVVTALRKNASGSQGRLLNKLALLQNNSEVFSYEPKWIVNMIYVKVTKRGVMELAADESIGMIYEDAPLMLDAPVEQSPADAQPGSAEPNLRAINAHKLWELGYGGQGTLVMNIDTGVNGVHPALQQSWRGSRAGVPWYHAWFDQKNPPSPVPTDYGTTKHGSHTMGIMLGLDRATSDTIGVAPQAEWIASPTIDVGFSPHTSYTLNAFQWAADPDSNPSTFNDVPDVISNSYQDPNVSSSECGGGAGYWAAVDALEAMGTAVVWSAGNAGPGVSTVTPPKNRISSNVNFFAVGNLNTSTPQPWVISNSSSRGPSKCDNQTVKPEVVAPGTTIRSALAGTAYGNLSGTSMAAPHVAGAIALLRSANPSMTGSELKEILLNTALDYGTPGEDNTYGNGLIDLWAAFQEISVANSRIQGNVTSSASSDTLHGVTVRNLTTGTTVTTNASGFYRFILPDTGTYIIKFVKLGYATRTDTLHASDDSTTYVHSVQLNPLPAPQLNVAPQAIAVMLSPGDSVTRTLSVANSGPAPSQLLYNLRIDGGVGGLLTESIGTASSAFTGGARFRGNRYLATARTVLREIRSYHIASVATEFRFAVYQSNTPTGTYTRIFDGPPVMSGAGTGFVSSGPISVQLDSGKYYAIGAGWQGSVTYYNGASIPAPVGFGNALSGVSISSYPPPATASITSTTTTLYYGGITTTSGKFITLLPSTGDTLGGSGLRNHNVHITTAYLDPAGGPYTGEIVVTSTDTVTGAIAVPVSVTFMPTTVGEASGGVPLSFALHQNYPNPFNPSTTIKFDLPHQSHVVLRLYDILGREVRSVLDETRSAGFHSAVMDASTLASGVYYYRIDAGNFIATRKMILLK